MSKSANTLEATELIEKLALEAFNLFYLGGEPDNPDSKQLEMTIKLVAEAWNLPREAADKPLEAIAAVREATRCEKNGKEAPLIPQEKRLIPQERILESNGGDEIMAVIWGLFEASTRLDTQEKRERLLTSARFMSDYLGMDEWIAPALRRAAK